MDRRLKLQEELESLLGSKNVYFQPPASVQLKYPAIIYSLETADSTYADNKLYKMKFKWQVILITKKLNLDLVRDIAEHFELCRYDRHYVSDNLYHDAYSLYY